MQAPPPDDNRPYKNGALRWLVLGFALVLVGFHLWVAFSGLIPNLTTRPAHMAFALAWVFIIAGSLRGSGWERWTGWAIGAAGILSCLFIIWERPQLVRQYGALSGWEQYLVAALLIFAALEMARRAIKVILPLVAAIVLAYGIFGHLIPGFMGHGGMPLRSFLGTLVLTEAGLWGALTGISVDVIALFIILGAFISAGQAGVGFMSFAAQIAGRLRGGTAKVSVVSSALYGSISGVAAANTASTGMITIPTMKRQGYPPRLAAAVEAVASTGGQIMPPIMGAGAFVMAELLRTPYVDIMVAATLPAALFFVAAWVGVDNFAKRLGLKGMERSALPGWGVVARTAPFFLVPFGVLIGALMFTQVTISFAAVYATLATWALLAFDADGGVSFKGWLQRTERAVVTAAGQIAAIAAIIICAGLIVGVFNMTGLGVKLTSIILSLSGGNLLAALVLTGLASLVLGMELPTTAAYIICVAVAGPALESLGLPPLMAHLFVFWYALLCTITPPVCGNVFIAAGIAETPWLPVAGTSMLLGLGLFLVPMAFVWNPSLLNLGSEPFLALAAAVKIGVGLWLFSLGLIGGVWGPFLRLGATALGLLVLFAGGI